MIRELDWTSGARKSIERRTTAADVDVRLTPASMDGSAWTARVLTARAKALFLADEIAVTGPVSHWLLQQAAEASLIVD